MATIDVSPLQRAVSASMVSGLLDPSQFPENEFLSKFNAQLIDNGEITVNSMGSPLLKMKVNSLVSDAHKFSDITPFYFTFDGISTEGPSSKAGQGGKESIVRNIADMESYMTEIKDEPSLTQNQGTYTFNNVQTNRTRHRGAVFRGGYQFGFNINDRMNYDLPAAAHSIITGMLINVNRLKFDAFVAGIYSSVEYQSSTSNTLGGFKEYKYDEFSYFEKIKEFKTGNTLNLIDNTTIKEMTSEIVNGGMNLEHFVIFVTYDDLQSYRDSVAKDRAMPPVIHGSIGIVQDGNSGAVFCVMPNHVFKKDANGNMIRFAINKNALIFKFGLPFFYMEQFMGSTNGIFKNSFDSSLAMDPCGGSSTPIALLRAGHNVINETPGGRVDAFSAYYTGKIRANGFIFFIAKK